MDLPQVSVLLPAYNAEATLPGALDSLLRQQGVDFEVVAVDDGSVDGTAAILAEHAARDSRIRPLALKHGGIVQALNAGLAQCRGEYVARMDADDVCLPDRLLLQAGRLAAGPDLGLVAGRVEFSGDRETAGGYARYVDWTNTLLSHEDISLGRFRESPFAHPSVMFRKKPVLDLGGYRDGDFPEDYELWLRMLENGVRMAKLPDTVLQWSDAPDRLSRTDSRYGMDNFYSIKARYLAVWLAKNNPLHPDVTIIGSGRVSRKRAELLCGHGIRISTYVDIDPRKIGHTIHGRPVIHRRDMPPPSECFAVSYVASHGADQDIAAFLTERGYIQGKNFILAA